MSEEKINVIKAARLAAQRYCRDNNLSLSKLDKQEYYYLGDCVCIMQPMPYYGTGLLEDIASQPKLTLTYIVGRDVIEPAEYTMQYLS